MLYAVIDIGSNAARLLFANAWQINNETYVEKASLIRIPLRLGNDVFSTGLISKEKVQDLVTTMQAYKLLIDVYKPAEVRVLATAAMREAANSEKILQTVKSKTKLEIRVISGREEANIIRSTNRMEIFETSKPIFFIDVGGGSTEISMVVNHKLIDLKSFKIGTLRMVHNNYSPDLWKRIENWLKTQMKDYQDAICVGSGGNINKLNKLYGDSEAKFLTTEKLKYAYTQLSPLTVDERMNRFGFRLDRADVIVPAAEIFLRIMNILKVDGVFVPKIGLADGMVHILHENFLKKNPGHSDSINDMLESVR
ncbi:MAG: Ppx/GppA family phosphatase [Bacteroidales bacterium]|nr:Ppx/GppA family phosphatase [Bacteroidales bacterium]